MVCHVRLCVLNVRQKMRTLSARRVFIRYSSCAGPMTIKAGIGIAAEPSASGVTVVFREDLWPLGGDYSGAVEEEILTTISEQVPEYFSATIIVEEIEFCVVGSSEAAFRTATRQASNAILQVSPVRED